jgi:hypothetical protein
MPYLHEKVCFCGLAEVYSLRKRLGFANHKSPNYKSATHKKGLGPQIANPPSAAFSEGPQT